MIERLALLTEVRRIDYKQYEWILERMDLQWKPRPEKENVFTIARMEGLRQLTHAYCDDVKAKKLADYRKELHNQKLPYLQQKIKNLQFIWEEQKLLKLQVTISQEQIDEVQAQIDVLVAERKQTPVETNKKQWKIL